MQNQAKPKPATPQALAKTPAFAMPDSANALFAMGQESAKAYGEMRAMQANAAAILSIAKPAAQSLPRNGNGNGRNAAAMILAALTRPAGASHSQLKLISGWPKCQDYPKEIAAKRGLALRIDYPAGFGGNRARYRAALIQGYPCRKKAADQAAALAALPESERQRLAQEMDRVMPLSAGVDPNESDRAALLADIGFGS